MSRKLKWACPCCGTWICGNCGWKRHLASRFWPGHRCARCGYSKGKIWAVYHQERLRIDHEEEWKYHQNKGDWDRIWDKEIIDPEWGLAWELRDGNG